MNKQKLIAFIVIAGLLGYIATSLLLFKEEVWPSTQGTNPALKYLASILTGLVGGIVASAFGVKDPTTEESPEVETSVSNYNRNMNQMGTYTAPTAEPNNKAKYGNLYAWAYFIIGILSIIIWVVSRGEASESITNISTSFLGMAVAIIMAALNSKN